MSRIVLASAIVLSAAACRVTHLPYGGPKEKILAAATVAGDPIKVAESLKAGANPNKLVKVNDDQQSPWYFALHQLRESGPERFRSSRRCSPAAPAPGPRGRERARSEPAERVVLATLRGAGPEGGHGRGVDHSARDDEPGARGIAGSPPRASTRETARRRSWTRSKETRSNRAHFSSRPALT